MEKATTVALTAAMDHQEGIIALDQHGGLQPTVRMAVMRQAPLQAIPPQAPPEPLVLPEDTPTHTQAYMQAQGISPLGLDCMGITIPPSSMHRLSSLVEDRPTGEQSIQVQTLGHTQTFRYQPLMFRQEAFLSLLLALHLFQLLQAITHPFPTHEEERSLTVNAMVAEPTTNTTAQVITVIAATTPQVLVEVGRE